MRRTSTPTATPKIRPWTKTTMSRSKLWSPLWNLPNLRLQSHQEGQQFLFHGQPFHSFNSNTFFLRNPLIQYQFLPSKIRTSNIGLLTLNTTLSGSKPCPKFTSPVTLPLPSTTLSTSLIASLQPQAAGIEFFPLRAWLRTSLLLQYAVLVPSRLESSGLPVDTQNPGLPSQDLKRIHVLSKGESKDEIIAATDFPRWWIARTTIPHGDPLWCRGRPQKSSKSEKDFNSTQHHVVILLLYKVYFFLLSSSKQGAEGCLNFYVDEAQKEEGYLKDQRSALNLMFFFSCAEFVRLARLGWDEWESIAAERPPASESLSIFGIRCLFSFLPLHISILYTLQIVGG